MRIHPVAGLVEAGFDQSGQSFQPGSGPLHGPYITACPEAHQVGMQTDVICLQISIQSMQVIGRDPLGTGLLKLMMAGTGIVGMITVSHQKFRDVGQLHQ